MQAAATPSTWPGKTLVDMIREDLVAERIAIDSYRDAIRYLDGHDPTTRRMLEEILAVEEEHADDLADLLQGLPVEPSEASASTKAGKGKKCVRPRRATQSATDGLAVLRAVVAIAASFVVAERWNSSREPPSPECRTDARRGSMLRIGSAFAALESTRPSTRPTAAPTATTRQGLAWT